MEEEKLERMARSSDAPLPAVSDQEDKSDVPPVKRDLRFWLIIAALAITSLLVSLEVTIVSTATATIVADLGGQSAYIWLPAAYLLAMCVESRLVPKLTSLQPLFGQLADIFGRRLPLFFSILTFMLGSGLCGGANDMTMLIAGRAVQGIGGAGINVLVELIVCDLVPLRERAQIMAIVLGASALGPAVGPIIGGAIVERSTWRWVFYLNLPVGGVGFALLLVVLRMRHNNKTDIFTSLKRIDWAGNTIFVGACASMLIATTWAGAVYPWASAQVLAPLIIGLVGLVGFFAFEGVTRLAPNPMVPLHLFGNRTSLVVFIITFLQGIVIVAVLYFLPVYFQAVLLSSPERAGVQLLPMVMLQIVFAILGGNLLQKTGAVRTLHASSFAGMVLGIGLLTTLDQHSSTAEWAVFQVILASALGLGVPIMLPAVQAKLADSDAASSTAIWGFLRTFGFVWGSVIPGAVFSNRFIDLAYTITDPVVRETFAGDGQALEHAAAKLINVLPEESRAQVIDVFSKSLQRTWQVLIAFAGLAFLLVFLEERVELRTALDTEYGIDYSNNKDEDKTSADIVLHGPAAAYLSAGAALVFRDDGTHDDSLAVRRSRSERGRQSQEPAGSTGAYGGEHKSQQGTRAGGTEHQSTSHQPTQPTPTTTLEDVKCRGKTLLSSTLTTTRVQMAFLEGRPERGRPLRRAARTLQHRPMFIQDPDAFHHDVAEIARDASGNEDFLARLHERRDRRFDELKDIQRKLTAFMLRGFHREEDECHVLHVIRLSRYASLDCLLAPLRIIP
ncbi:Uncharacterized protein TCAP_06764 [Tolypocladium capitatum]|uniref:Major facilitator superfamily (MFS) profile domain-containing protein n=1 Tax=Tolypocladium capitatum TaxID=45235 RepID=A0A2K3Q6V4_9HYPO|nr:Uncharacterized protein TCAP_06764 [Tolypocladium capitatum]